MCRRDSQSPIVLHPEHEGSAPQATTRRSLLRPRPPLYPAPPVVVFPPLPAALPHPVLCGRVAQWIFTAVFTCLLALGTVAGLARASHAAEPCSLPAVDAAQLDRGLAALAHAPRPEPSAGWHRLGALLPHRVAWSLRDLQSDGAGWYQAAGGDVSERGLWGQSGGWSVKLIWDLEPLWRPAPRPQPGRLGDPLVRADRLQQVASRLATRLERLAELRQRAVGLVAGEEACGRLRAKAQALLLVVGATLRSAGG